MRIIIVFLFIELFIIPLSRKYEERMLYMGTCSQYMYVDYINEKEIKGDLTTNIV